MGKGGTIMGLVAADALQDPDDGTNTLNALIEEANENSELCTFADGALNGDVYEMTAVGKDDLADEYFAAFCVDYKTGKKESKTSATEAPAMPTCEVTAGT